MDGNEAFGPIDVVVIGFPSGAPASGDAIPLLLDLVDRQVIRVLDALFVRKDDDGTFASFDLADLDPNTARDLTALAGASTGMLNEHDAGLAAAEIEPGGAAVLIVYENRWAAPFIDAVRRNGGVLIANERIGVQELVDALDSVEAVAPGGM